MRRSRPRGLALGFGLALLAVGRAFALPVPDLFLHFHNASTHLVKLCDANASHCSDFAAGTAFDESEATNGQMARWLKELFHTATVKVCGRTLALDRVAAPKYVTLKGGPTVDIELDDRALRQACAGRKG